MALKIRLRQQGRKNCQTYRLVLTESRSPRDGKYLETLGWYNPQESEPEKMLSLQADRVQHWVKQGAIVTERAEILIKKGAPHIVEEYKKHRLAQVAKACEKKRTIRKKQKEARA